MLPHWHGAPVRERACPRALTRWEHLRLLQILAISQGNRDAGRLEDVLGIA
jgi:hypothetical protein